MKSCKTRYRLCVKPIKRQCNIAIAGAEVECHLSLPHGVSCLLSSNVEGMSAKAKERFDKEKAQREADADKYLQYALTIGRMKDADKQRGLQAWQTEQALARQDRAFDAGRKDRAADVAFMRPCAFQAGG